MGLLGAGDGGPFRPRACRATARSPAGPGTYRRVDPVQGAATHWPHGKKAGGGGRRPLQALKAAPGPWRRAGGGGHLAVGHERPPTGFQGV